MNLILAAAHGPFTDGGHYRAFLNSFAANARPHGVHLTVYTGSMGEDARRRTRAVAELCEVPGNFSDGGNKQRHWYFAQHLFAGRHRSPRPELAMTVDARDTVFFGDPFAWAHERSGHEEVWLSAEPTMTDGDDWNRNDSAAFRAALRGQCRSAEPWRVVNGGFVCGRCQPMAYFQLGRFAIDARDGPGTDQASLTALGHWTRGWPGIVVEPPETPWVVHCHHAERLLAAGLVRRDGPRVLLADGRPYPLVHQWDRHPGLRAAVLAAFDPG